jgi:hypothetical protein
MQFRQPVTRSAFKTLTFTSHGRTTLQLLRHMRDLSLTVFLETDYVSTKIIVHIPGAVRTSTPSTKK